MYVFQVLLILSYLSCTQISCLSNGVVLVCSRCLQFNQFSVPLSLSNMNNVHNTFFVVTLIYNVVHHFLSELKKTMFSLFLAFNTSNALEYFDQR